jgi:gluconate 5-dehydrogenase
MANALDLFKLDGKVAVVTGGGHGLGYFMAEGLAEAGANVAICGRNAAVLDKALVGLRATGRDCIAIVCDVTKEDDVQRMAARVKEHYGRCDVLVNNAGIGSLGPSEQLTLAAWRDVLDINLTGSFLCCRELGKLMIAQSSGSIINISSENGQVGFSFGMTAYATTKIGAVGMARSLAVEWGKHGIRVNAILPGNMQEGMMELLKDREGPYFKMIGDPLLRLIPLKSFGTGDDMKGAVVFLASDAGRYVSGAMLIVDGGFTINAGM